MARFDVETALANAPQQEVTRKNFDVTKALATEKPRYRGGYQPKSSPVQGFMSAMQGSTLGFLDEAVGGLSALGKITQGADAMAQQYRDARDAVRANVEDYEKDYPTLATLSRVAASAPTAVLLPQFKLAGLATAPTSSRAAVMGANMLRAGLTAGTYGAINAAGNSESEDGMGMLGDIALGGATSMAMGGITPPVASVLGGGVRRIATSPLNPMRDKASLSFAERKVAESLLRDMPDDVANASLMTTSVNELNRLGPRAKIVDTGDDAARGLLDVVANLPGKGQKMVSKAIEERIATRGGQIVRAADRALGTGGAELRGSLQAMDAARQTAAAPLYGQLRGMDVPVTQSLAGALAAADDLGALALGRRSAIANQSQFTLNGPPPVGSRVSMSDLDYSKRGLDSLIEKEIDAATGKISSLGRDYMRLRTALVNELDGATIDPATGQSIYAAARAAWAGPSRSMELANLGRNIFSKDKNWVIRDAIEGATASELAAMRLGIVQAVKEKAGTQSGQTWLINNWKNPAHRDAIKLAFGSDSRTFLESLQKFGKMKKLEQVGVGSQTFRREAGAEDLGMEPVQDLARAAAAAKTGNLAGITDYVGKMANRLNVPEPVRNQIAKIMLMRGPEARAQLIKMGAMLEQLNRQQAAQAQVAGQFVGRLNPWLMPEGQ